RLRDHRLLPRDHREIGGGGFDLLAVGDRLADAHVEHDLVERGHLHGVLVAELLDQRLAHHLLVVAAHAGGTAAPRRLRPALWDATLAALALGPPFPRL